MKKEIEERHINRDGQCFKMYWKEKLIPWLET